MSAFIVLFGFRKTLTDFIQNYNELKIVGHLIIIFIDLVIVKARQLGILAQFIQKGFNDFRGIR